MKDLSLHYAGGSGGFIALHLILLTKKYFCSFLDTPFINEKNFDKNFAKIMDDHWNISSLNSWKLSEWQPVNENTEIASTSRNKIFFHCSNYICEHNAETILIYTDIKSQNSLAKLKKSYWYTAIPSPTHRLIWQNYYNSIKAEHWGEDADLTVDFNSLPKYQQDEILAIMPAEPKPVRFARDEPVNLNEDAILTNYIELDNGIRVLPAVADFYKKADHKILLQDIINTKGKALTDSLNIEHNEEQVKLVNRWISLHPADFLPSIGIPEHNTYT
jgi:hypothetical protein